MRHASGDRNSTRGLAQNAGDRAVSSTEADHASRPHFGASSACRPLPEAKAGDVSRSGSGSCDCMRSARTPITCGKAPPQSSQQGHRRVARRHIGPKQRAQSHLLVGDGHRLPARLDGCPEVEVQRVVLTCSASGTIDVVDQSAKSRVQRVLQTHAQVGPGLTP